MGGAMIQELRGNTAKAVKVETREASPRREASPASLEICKPPKKGLAPPLSIEEFHPVCHSERSEESTGMFAPPKRFASPAGFFAPLLVNVPFVILNAVKNPRSRPPLPRGFFAALRTTIQ
jgi:hypothetical protein